MVEGIMKHLKYFVAGLPAMAAILVVAVIGSVVLYLLLKYLSGVGLVIAILLVVTYLIGYIRS